LDQHSLNESCVTLWSKLLKNYADYFSVLEYSVTPVLFRSDLGYSMDSVNLSRKMMQITLSVSQATDKFLEFTGYMSENNKAA
jgi:hypothetical protein